MPEARVVENFLAMSRETTAWVKCVSYGIRGRASETDYQAGLATTG